MGTMTGDPVSLASVLNLLADFVAERVVARLADTTPAPDRWLSTGEAASHLAMHPDTLRRLAAARVIPAEQDGPGCCLHFRLSELDRWRESGGPRSPAVRQRASTPLPRNRKPL
jgi:excisionase family DNA binding protein